MSFGVYLPNNITIKMIRNIKMGLEYFLSLPLSDFSGCLNFTISAVKDINAYINAVLLYLVFGESVEPRM